MRGEVVHDHDVAGAQGGCEAALDVGSEDRRIHRPVDNEGRARPALAQPGHEGGGLPVTMGHGRDQPRAPLGTAVAPGHSRRTSFTAQLGLTPNIRAAAQRE